MLSEDYHNLPIAFYEEGSFFGEIEVFKNLKRCFTCIAADNLELLAMEKADFKKIFGRYNPDLFKLFLVVAERRWKDVELVLKFIGDMVDPQHKNTDAIKFTNKLKEENEIVARISRQTSALIPSKATSHILTSYNEIYQLFLHIYILAGLDIPFFGQLSNPRISNIMNLFYLIS